MVLGPSHIERGRVGILPGSFNPPTIAHTNLASAALRQFSLDHVVYSLSSIIVDKEQAHGLCQEDRLFLLSLLARDLPSFAVALVNRGLYSDQALAFRASFGDAVELWFIVGMDKVLQIFDPKYYDDREQALELLFANAQLVAANRGDRGASELHALLEKPQNAPYRNRVHSLALSPDVKDQSSSGVRCGVEEGLPWEHVVSEVVQEFVVATKAFRHPYDLRVAALNMLYPIRQRVEMEVAFDTLVVRAAAPGESGEAVRKLLFTPMTPEVLLGRLRSLGLTRPGG